MTLLVKKNKLEDGSSSQMSRTDEENSNGSGSRASPAEPDPDTIKMFVGQIPRQWNEPECRRLFEKYGPVYSLNILRDKNTQQSKGCCFVTYFHRKDAINAQGALHNIEVIDGMHHPIQMKPADTENRNERKLFIGQLSKKQNEEDVRQLFSRFGHIEDVSVLRDTDGRSRGCAFVTFATRNCAVNATKEMHHVQTMEGCTAPLVVKFADSQKERENRNTPKGSTPNIVAAPVISNPGLITGLSQFGAQPGLNLQALTALAALIQPGQPNVLAALGNALTTLGKLTAAQGVNEPAPNSVPNATQNNGTTGGQQQQQQLQSAQQIAALLQQQGGDALALQQTQMAQQIALQAQQQHDLSAYGYATQPALSYPGKKAVSPVDTYQQSILQQYALNTVMGTIPQATQAMGNGDTKGPEGSNLFIYHLPQDFGDGDLLSIFAPFGNILSAKVFIDKVTNLSKCFGFVSYDNALSAQNAISAMNGFQIASKRLKVQLKNERQNPYAKAN